MERVREKWSLDYRPSTKKEVVSVIGGEQAKEMEDYVDNNGWGDFSARYHNGRTVYCKGVEI